MASKSGLSVRWGWPSRSHVIAIIVIMAIGYFMIANDWRVTSQKQRRNAITPATSE